MPTLSTFFGIVIRMYFRDHAPPRFHAYYQGHEALIGIEGLEVIGGSPPRRALGLVLDWAELHRRELRENWERAELRLNLSNIDLWSEPMKRMTKISALAGHRLAVEFEDGVSGTVHLDAELTGPMFEPLRDETLFSQVRLDEFGAPCWPNGADLAPDAIYAELTGRSIVRSAARQSPLPLKNRFSHGRACCYR